MVLCDCLFFTQYVSKIIHVAHITVKYYIVWIHHIIGPIHQMMDIKVFQLLVPVNNTIALIPSFVCRC